MVTRKKAKPHRSTSARKTSTSKQVAKKAAPLKTIRVKQTQTQIISDVSDICQHDKKVVRAVLDSIKQQMSRHVRHGGSGEMMIPGIGIKVKRFKKKATKARMGRNPFTGEEIKIKAKPASLGVRARALKALKELAK